jgi:16S rRNA (cytidine1402-2'-O)-methyltransferase
VTQLTLVPTPIGNLKDITLRALEVLETVDVVAAEDTRRTRKLLKHYEIATPLVRLDQHTISSRAQGVLERNESVAFVTDAGTPGISDPGTDLLRLALGLGVKIEVLPGATALVPALVLSGLTISRFVFEGFLPRKGRARKERLEGIAVSEITVAFYEGPGRVRATLEDLLEVCGPERDASLSREISKRFETTVRGDLRTLVQVVSDRPLKGEVVLVIGPITQRALPVDNTVLARRLASEGLHGWALREALAARGIPRNEAYLLALEVSGGS